MSDPLFEIGAPGIDVDKIVTDIRASVEQKKEQGLYTDARVARAERTNLANLKDQEDFLSFYLECLRDAALVDINDFEIYERRQRFGRLLVLLKRLIWKLLKFYTYRLWSQQNHVNGLLLSAIEGIDSSTKAKIKELEDRIEELEAGNTSA
jgi:hypothetical protein